MSSYEYQSHVKVVVVIDAVFLVLAIFYGISQLIMLVGVGMSEGAHRGTNPHENIGFYIGWVVFQTLVVCLSILIYYLLYSGRRDEKVGRLKAWWILRSIGVVGLIILTGLLLTGGGALILFIFLIVGIYCIYTIHVVRCHANEIQEGNQRQIGV